MIAAIRRALIAATVAHGPDVEGELYLTVDAVLELQRELGPSGRVGDGVFGRRVFVLVDDVDVAAALLGQSPRPGFLLVRAGSEAAMYPLRRAERAA